MISRVWIQLAHQSDIFPPQERACSGWVVHTVYMYGTTMISVGNSLVVPDPSPAWEWPVIWLSSKSLGQLVGVHSLTHCCAWPARAVATSTTSDPPPMTTESRLCTRDPLPPVVSRSSLAGQVDASSRGQDIICPARGWHSTGGCCGLAHLVVGGKHLLAMSVFCRLWWEVDPSALSGSERNHWWRSHATLCSGCAVVPSCEKPAIGPSRLWSESTSQDYEVFCAIVIAQVLGPRVLILVLALATLVGAYLYLYLYLMT